MKVAAAKAIAQLAKLPVPDMVAKAYNKKSLTFGSEYIIPKPLDPRLLTEVSSAVAKAAIDSGLARDTITDWDAYKTSLVERLGNDDSIIRVLTNKAKTNPKRVVYPEAQEDYKVLKAAQIALDEEISTPILLGNKEKIEALIKEYSLDLEGAEIIDPRSSEVAHLREKYAQLYFEKRKRRGVNLSEARSKVGGRYYFGMMMVETGDADAFLAGSTRRYGDVVKPALQIIGTEEGKTASSMYMMLTKKGPMFFSDTTMVPSPSSEDLADITFAVAETVRTLGVEPTVALLSYSNFGSSNDEEPKRVRKAVQIIKNRKPDFVRW